MTNRHEFRGNFDNCATNYGYTSYFQCACANLAHFYFRSEIRRHRRVPGPRFKLAVLAAKLAKGGALLTPTNLFLFLGLLGVLYATFGEIDQEMRPWECGQTNRQTDRNAETHRHKQTEFTICSLLCAIAMGQIINTLGRSKQAKICSCCSVVQGVTRPSMSTLLSEWAPPLERSKMATFLYSGRYTSENIAKFRALPYRNFVYRHRDGDFWRY